MRTRSSYVATAVALGILSLTGCAVNHGAGTDDGAPAPGEDWGDENKYPEIGGAYASLTALVGTCAFSNGTVTVTSTTGQNIVIGKRAVDSVILVNGAECRTVPTQTVPATAANSTTMKRLVVTGSSSAEALVLDFLGGLFAPGVSTAAAGGIAIDMGGGTDIVNIRGTAAADTLFVGADGIAFNADNYKDITLVNNETLNIALAGGNDALTATNAAPTKGVTGNANVALTVFGGAGNDIIIGGAQADTIYGGPGNDTLSGGAGADFLYGDEGADIMQGTATADGDDTLDCGNESDNVSVDIVSYDKRTNAIVAIMAGGTQVQYPDDAGDGSVSNNMDAGDAGDGGVADGGDAGGGGGFGTSGENNEHDLIGLNCEGITGGAGNDNLVGNASDNTISGGAGNDTITGGDGDDILNGNDGNDWFVEGTTINGGDIFNGGAGTDTVDYSLRTASLTITMDGSSADDGEDNETDNVKADIEDIIGGSDDDTITGNTAANNITGGLGDDTLSGGAGPDTFYEGPVASGADEINGGAGVDTVSYRLRSTTLKITMDGVAADDGEFVSNVSEGDDINSDVENLIGGSAADDITGNDLGNSIEGGNGDDVIHGGDGDDDLDGTDRGASVNNTIVCGLGDDNAYNKGDLGSYSSDCELQSL